MDADIHLLYESDFYCIRDFKCRCTDCKTSRPEYSHSFCISYVRKGNFLFNVFRRSLDSHTGCILVTRPGYERTVTHIHTVPDECTIFEFKPAFYKAVVQNFESIKFLTDDDWHSTLVKTTAELEFLHHAVLTKINSRTADKLEIDQMVMEIVSTVLAYAGDYKPQTIGAQLKKNHLTTIELAKDYITRHFQADISLSEIAGHCCVSAFHFSRIFKSFTSVTPHQFLLTVRLKNAEMLLHNSSMPVADVAFSSGFNSVEHFTYAFRQKYRFSPARFRNKVAS